MFIKKLPLLFLTLFILTACQDRLNLEQLAPQDQATLDSLLLKTENLLAETKAQGVNPNRLEISDLQEGLSDIEKKFLKKILRLRPADLGSRTPPQDTGQKKVIYHALENQPVFQNGERLSFLAPLVSEPVYQSFESMMSAMEKDIGKRMYIESGHRSMGYHLYNFLKYLRSSHNYSLIKTGRLNALPGYSQHNIRDNHAVDLINAEGINGDPNAEEYENLPEHQWMLKHAEEFGFTLTYPRGNPWGIDFEPWHWLYQPDLSAAQTVRAEN